MPRANRHFLPGYVWHITHRCHHKQFLLKFARDRRRYLHWVFEAKKRFGLSVLNYVQGLIPLVGLTNFPFLAVVTATL
jgi:putative transposase